MTLGLDVYTLRAFDWTPFQFLDYAASLGFQLVHFSEARFLNGLDHDHLRRVKEHADERGLQLEVGMRSICPTSERFDPAAGPAGDQIIHMLEIAQILGSPILRAFVGDWRDRPIERHIEATLPVLHAVRNRVLDAGIKLAIENHAGDLQARELKILIEAAGRDFVGACLDSGNPVWALEDPFLSLDTLAPYVLTTHIRDSALWEERDGIAFQWMALGEGTIGIDQWIIRFGELCPGRPLSLEIITGRAPTVHRVWDPEFWRAFPSTPAWEFARFVRRARSGAPPGAQAPSSAASDRASLERSVRYCRQLLQEQRLSDVPVAG